MLRQIKRSTLLTSLMCASIIGLGPDCPADSAQSVSTARPFEIQVIDQQTRRGIPMVTLTTVDDVVYITDNAGRAAIQEPELEGQAVWFSVHSPGYSISPDQFGMTGVRARIVGGERLTVVMDRTNIAERMYRITGRNLYVDSTRLGYSVPLPGPLPAGGVVGQDSIQAAVYRGQIHWFWGDTNRLKYPLGLFRTAGAVSPAPSRDPDNAKPAEPVKAERSPDTDSAAARVPSKALDASVGVDLRYFTDDEGFVRAMVEVADDEGVVWIDGVCVVPDETGAERMVAHYSRREGLARQLEHGLLLYNDQRELFEVALRLPDDETWRFIRDHPSRWRNDQGLEYLVFGNPFPVTRVPAQLKHVLDLAAYESFCSPAPEHPERREWRSQAPTTQKEEWDLWKNSQLDLADARFLPVAADQLSDTVERPSLPPTLMHSGTVRFNRFRNSWVMIAVSQATQKEAPSFLGEVWFSEADSPTGPFRKAVKLATHPKQTFYNPAHHSFLDQEDGRWIYFEGTYCNTFTSSPATPLYNYNQMMYRVDLSDQRLRAAGD